MSSGTKGSAQLLDEMSSLKLVAWKKPYIGLVGVCSVVPLLWLVVIGKEFLSDGISAVSVPTLLLSISIPSFWAIWLRWYRLEITGDGIRYRRPFFPTVYIPWSLLMGVQSKDVMSGKRVRPGSFLGIIILLYDNHKRLSINPSVFDPAKFVAAIRLIESAMERRSSADAER